MRRQRSAESRAKTSKSMLGNQNAKCKHKSVRRKCGYILITDGTTNKRLLIGLPIPEGWHQGMTVSEEVSNKRRDNMTKQNKGTLRYRNKWTRGKWRELAYRQSQEKSEEMSTT